jgi:DNA-binding NtrC family response regulator
MKRILVVDDRRDSWEDVAQMLEEVNAEVHIRTVPEAVKLLEIRPPALLVLGEGALQAVGAESGGVTRIILNDDIPPGEIIRSREGRNVIRVGRPVGKDAFLELTRRALSVPERRTYHAPVKIAVKKEGRDLPGKSEDFSLTGMAFRTSGILAQNDEVAVSVVNGESGDLRLDGRVVRSVPGRPGEDTLYGMNFLNMQPGLKHALERFVWRLRRKIS